ncbi:MAG: hypothetical protein ITG02_01450 [Patulibacter sp.]|nr:hypothetical protein [Patulibacter sp.]
MTAVTAAAPAVAGAKTVEVTPPPIEQSLPMKQTAVRVAVKNTGKRALRNLRFSVRSTKGVRVRVAGAKKGQSSRTLKTLRAGKTTRVTVRLQRLKGGPTKGAVTVRVKRGKRTVGSEKLRFGVPPLTGRYFWGSTYTISGIRQETLYFATDGLVYTDDMEGSYATCPAADEKCRPYLYDGDSGTLVIDGKPAVLSGGKIDFDGQTYFEWGVPPAGTRFDANVTYANSSGLCPLYCNYFQERLRFSADGMVVRGAVASGSGPVVDYSVVPPSSLATYEVRADGTILMAFADGKQRVETIAFYKDDAGKLKPASDGMLLNGDGYFDISKND